MRLNRRSTVAHSIVLSVLSVSLFLTPLFAKPAPEPDLRADCERALATCMNNGGDPDACWNAYWRCSSR
jgi:hypothetical protein